MASVLLRVMRAAGEAAVMRSHAVYRTPWADLWHATFSVFPGQNLKWRPANAVDKERKEACQTALVQYESLHDSQRNYRLGLFSFISCFGRNFVYNLFRTWVPEQQGTNSTRRQNGIVSTPELGIRLALAIIGFVRWRHRPVRTLKQVSRYSWFHKQEGWYDFHTPGRTPSHTDLECFRFHPRVWPLGQHSGGRRRSEVDRGPVTEAGSPRSRWTTHFRNQSSWFGT